MKPFVHPETYVKRRIQEVGIESDGVLCYSKAYHDAMFANLLTMLRMIDLPKGMSVLDVGAGKFDLYKFLLENGYTIGSYTGVDYSPELIEYGMNRFPSARGFVGDFMDMDDKARYDLVVSTGAMPY